MTVTAHNAWMLVFGGIFAFLNAFAVGASNTHQRGLLGFSSLGSQVVAGANMPANCWGPAIGAKVVRYRTAVLLGIACELFGVLVFGPRVAIVYHGILTDWTVLKPSPGLTMYALIWAEITLVTWQFLAIWKQILAPVFLGSVASLIGAAFVFPGVGTIDAGTTLSKAPFLSGLGPVFLVWLIAPLMALTLVTFVFLVLRTSLLRGEDPFHKVLWAMPALACGTAMVWGLQVFYSLGSSQGRPIVTWSPQATVLLLVLIGIGGCLVTCLAVPRVQRLRCWRAPTIMPLKRMNLLGLDEVTVRELAADERAGDMKGCLQRLHAWLFEGDIFATVASNEALLRIHSTAEEFEGAAEDCFAVLQVITSIMITIAYSCNNVRTSVGLYAIMLHIHQADAVTRTAPIKLWLLVFGAVGMCLGTLLCGFRLVPVTATQIAKMTPFRSFCVVVVSALTLTIMALLQLKGGTITYVIVAAVLSVGLAEGFSHVNWKKVHYTIVWWAIGFGVVMLCTTVLVAQGVYAPSLGADESAESLTASSHQNAEKI